MDAKLSFYTGSNNFFYKERIYFSSALESLSRTSTPFLEAV
jgi:hypothetical protein